ncbi:BACON domain-containing carbohydrate-binding protein [Porphyromonas sp.]|uniref:BACON domain-containing protein n=1 Tax=Porphyromonas sp. TaxID=1924944 RepID=UPI0026DD688C|nr:BACON domain-containing carbohydrate-binding protein [Porphyromonas sp.]MDO4770634.1 BACON domain-containing carbohydrate-binding protein [Porphyromonas sp.]
MKHLLKYTTVLIGLLTIGLYGCTRDILPDEDNSVELTLSQSVVLLDNTTTKADVNITTTRDSWSCITSAEWLECTKSENKMHLMAKLNDTGHERVATVIVTAGETTEQVVVKQAATTGGIGGSISTDKTEFQVDQWGDTFVIPVYTHSKTWEVISSEDWVSVRPNLVKGSIQIVVAETEERPDREANILVRETNTGDYFSVKISQKGIMFIILPYLKFGTTIDPLMEFEEARKSTVIGRPGDNSGAYGAVNKDLWKFATKSKLFTRMEYRFAGDKMTQAYAYSDIYELDKAYDEFTAYLEDLGFIPDDKKFKFFNKKMEMMAELGLGAGGNEIYLLYTYLPNQKEAYPTFEVFPGRLSNIEGWTGYDKDKIHEWETANGGVTNKKDGTVSSISKTRTIYYTSVNPLAPEKTTYTLKPSAEEQGKEKITGFSLKFREVDTSKFFWEKDGNFYLTNEFMSLCTKSKMRYVGKNSDVHIFTHTETGAFYRIKVTGDPGKASVTMDVTP